MARPYSNLLVTDLERIVEQNWDNCDLLRDVLNELSQYRTRKGAKTLQRKVEERLAKMPQSQSAGSSASPTKQTPKSTPQPAPKRAPQPTPKPDSLPKQPMTDATVAPPQIVWTPFVPPPPGPQQPFPPFTNDPIAILSSWTALEVLSPPSFVRPEDLASGDRRRVAWIDQAQLPWERGEKSRPNYRLYYQIVLGTMKLEPAVESLIQKYGDTRPERPGVRGEAALAVVVVDRVGKLVESPAVGISSFAWGVMRALTADLSELARWPSVEPELVKKVERRLIGMTSDEQDETELRKHPLSREALLTTFATLVTELGLPPDWIEVPSFAVRSYSYFRDRNPPEPLVLNSFFLTDLALACGLSSQGKAPLNLQKYLGAIRPQIRRDLLVDTVALADAVSPTTTPLGRWPSIGRHPLALLQQAAVNLAFHETRDGGLVGVNGPPGTGKTTLLRDVVAGVVTERAIAMCSFDDPESAFVASGQRLPAGQGWIHLYRVDSRLRGFEMVVASSNNKAVENVSAELPAMTAIAADADGLRYLKTLSDGLHSTDTWGAIAAVLGNALNRSRFSQTFWWDDDVGLSSYLRAAVGANVEIDAVDPVTGNKTKRLPRIVEIESPPKSHVEALQRWHTARKQFREAVDAARKCQTHLETLRVDLSHLDELLRAERDSDLQLKSARIHCRNTSPSPQMLAQSKPVQLKQSHLPIKNCKLTTGVNLASERDYSERRPLVNGQNREAGLQSDCKSQDRI